MGNFFKGTNNERIKWLAVMLLGIFVIVLNSYLKSVPSIIYRSTIEFISDMEQKKLS